MVYIFYIRPSDLQFFVNCMQHSFGVEVTEINGFINHGEEAKVHSALLANSAH